MHIKRFGKSAALAVVAALTLAACSTPAIDGAEVVVEETDVVQVTEPGQTAPATEGGARVVTIGRDQPFFAYNNLTPNGNHTANSDVLQFTQQGFYWFDDQLDLVENTDFGTITVVNEDPFTVELHVNDGVVWSDGTLIDAYDLFLAWGAQQDKFDTVGAGDLEVDEDGNPIVPEHEVFFAGGSSIMAQVDQTPTISDDGRTLTMVFDHGPGPNGEPSSDWKMGVGLAPVAAHVIGRRALGIDDPTEAKHAVVEAFRNNDGAALAPMSDVWSRDFMFTTLPDDPGLFLSSGPFKISSITEGQNMVLDRNPLYHWGPMPNVDQIVFRWMGDPMALVQALQNRDVDIIGPQASVDMLAALEGLPGVETVVFEDSAWEHLDLTYNNGGPFDPATYGGNEETARLVRNAFLAAIPRQQIVDTLIRPLQSDAEVRNSLIFAPIGDLSDYNAAVAANGAAGLFPGDPARAQELLAEAGVTTPIDVRILFGDNVERRVQQVEFMRQALEPAGFNLIPTPHVPFGARLGDGTYDAALFAWVSTNPYLLNSMSTYASADTTVPCSDAASTPGFNNFGGFCNDRVNELWRVIQTTQSPAEERAAGIEIDQILLNDGMSMPIFQHPGLLAHSDRLTGVVPMPIGPQWMWNFWEWDVAPAAQ